MLFYNIIIKSTYLPQFFRPMQKIFFLISFIICSTHSLFAQITGGRSTFAFLNLVPSARVASLGGNALAVWDKDVNLAFHNPSLIDSNLHRQGALSYVNYLSDIAFGAAVYGHRFKKIGTLVGAVQYVNYGTFQGADETGNLTTTFGAAEYNIQLGYAYSIRPKIKLGTNLKYISSSFETYTSWGMAGDLAVSYVDTGSRFVVSLIAKNIGYQFKPYVDGNREPLPFDVQLGVSKRLAKAPFRYGIVLQNLTRFNTRYNDPNDIYYRQIQLDQNGQPTTDTKPHIGDKMLRHVILNGEFLLGKALQVRVGYNHLRRRELALPNGTGRNGFTFGAGLKLGRLHVNYANSAYSLAATAHHFSMNLYLSR